MLNIYIDGMMYKRWYWCWDAWHDVWMTYALFGRLLIV